MSNTEEEYMHVQWDQITEQMHLSYHSRKRIIERVGTREKEEVKKWLAERPALAAQLLLRSSLIVRTE